MTFEVPVRNMILSAGSSVDLDIEDNILSIDRMEDGTDIKVLESRAVLCNEISIESSVLHASDQCIESNGRVPFGTLNSVRISIFRLFQSFIPLGLLESTFSCEYQGSLKCSFNYRLIIDCQTVTISKGNSYVKGI